MSKLVTSPEPPGLLPLIGMLAESKEGPAAGEVAGEVAALASALCAAAADRSRDCWAEAGGARAQALSLCRRALAYAERNAEAYAHARAALAARGGEPSPQRDHRLGVEVRLAADPPLEIASLAADIAHLAAEVADHGAPDHRPDAVVAARLAAGAASAAAHLVEVNLVASADPELPSRARRYAANAAESAERCA
jgi:formiminotetrahydrofolate cyclodeaminase